MDETVRSMAEYKVIVAATTLDVECEPNEFELTGMTEREGIAVRGGMLEHWTGRDVRHADGCRAWGRTGVETVTKRRAESLVDKWLEQGYINANQAMQAANDLVGLTA